MEVDPSIRNSGFEECFWYPERVNRLIPCVRFYDRIDCPRMVNIFLSVLLRVRELHGDDFVDGDFSDEYLVGFSPISNSLTELDFLYYDELKQLPRLGGSGEPSVRNSVSYYLDKFPEDF